MFQNKDFRIGLSHAINRQQIIDLVYQRQGEPWQTAPRPDVPFYTSDDFGTQYTEFDLDLAQAASRQGRLRQDRRATSRLIGRGRQADRDLGARASRAIPTLIDAMEFVKRDVGRGR